MHPQIIPVVYASDENFLKQTYVSIYSVLANRKENYELKFYILIPEDCEEQNYNEQWKFFNYSIEYISISANYFHNVKMLLQNISKPTYFRLLIPMLLSEFYKCVYLDGDTICLCDIRELFVIELENNLLAGAMGAVIPFDTAYKEKVLNVQDATYYINAGVLVMNLKQMREENKLEEFLRCSEKQLPCQDQDVLNICCYKRIRLLPLKYNIYNTAFNMSVEMLMERYKREDIEEAFAKPAIIHYPGEFAKPWNNIKCIKSKEWWIYAKSAFDRKVIDELQTKAIEKMESYSYSNLFQEIEKCKYLVIFGFSEIGQKFCDQLDEKYPGKVVCFCDNSKEKWEKTYKEYKVISTVELKQKYSDALIIITSQRYSNVIKKQLLEEDFKSEKILVYRKKTLNYKQSMDNIYWDEMEKDIYLDDISWSEYID